MGGPGSGKRGATNKVSLPLRLDKDIYDWLAQSAEQLRVTPVQWAQMVLVRQFQAEKAEQQEGKQ